MEVPPLVILYAVLAAGGVAALFYIYTLYDSSVYQINSAACRELQYLTEVALQRAVAEPGNYTAYINATYVVVIERGLLVVGRDTRRPAACNISEVVERICAECTAKGACRSCVVLDSTGRSIVVEKTADQYAECTSQTLPYDRYVKVGGRLYVSRQCGEGALVENPRVEVYAH